MTMATQGGGGGGSSGLYDVLDLILDRGLRKPAGLTESGGRGMAKGVLSGAAEAMSDAFHQARGEGRSRRG
ncbi:hypothetical protein [Streptomyces murinus]